MSCENWYMFKRYFAALAAGLILFPLAANAQIVLSDSGKAQLAQLAGQLVIIFNQISQAQGQGTAYTQSAQFQVQAASWTQQLVQIQQQLAALLTSSQVQVPVTPTYGGNGSSASCPMFSRDLEPGVSGSDVAALQLYLAREVYAQYQGNVTGYFDNATMQAVQRYQAATGIKNFGTYSTTGYGRVGPATQASIQARCANNNYVVTTPPINVPATPYNPAPAAPGYSTGQLTLVDSLTGQSGGPNSVTFRVNMQPNSSCSASTFVLSFGDGQQQNVTSSASCGNQIQTFAHVYPQTGTYNATLTSGTFSTTLVVNIQPANNSVSLSAANDQNVSLGGVITATYNPGNTCVPGTYTIVFGDGNSQNISFTSGCSTQTQTLYHTYPQATSYLIKASDALGRTVTTSFTAKTVGNAGAGDPFQVVSLHGEGTNNSTTFTESTGKHAFTGSGAYIDTNTSAIGDASIRFNGSSYIATPASSDFNFGTGPFTVDFWFAAGVLPAANTQAALLMQAGPTALDTSLGGVGLELFGDKLYFVGTIGSVTYHPFYNNSIHSNSLTAGTWYHAALVRSGNVVTLYINGTSVGSLTVSGSTNASTNAFTFGRYGEYPGNYFNGWLDEVDVAKGTARWTGNFTPPGMSVADAQPLPIVSDTSWAISTNPASGWQNTDFDDTSWSVAVDEGAMGVAPWTNAWISAMPAGSVAKWIWYRASNNDTAGQENGVTTYFRKQFTSTSASATLYISADNDYNVYLNGALIASGSGGRAALPISVLTGLNNTIAVAVTNGGGPAGLLVDIR